MTNKEYAYQMLDDIGVPVHLKGYEFIAECIAIKMDCKEIGIAKTYTLVAQQTGGTWSRVERSVRYAIEYLLQYCDVINIVRYFGNAWRTDNKITNKQFIVTMAFRANRLKKEESDA